MSSINTFYNLLGDAYNTKTNHKKLYQNIFTKKIVNNLNGINCISRLAYFSLSINKIIKLSNKVLKNWNQIQDTKENHALFLNSLVKIIDRKVIILNAKRNFLQRLFYNQKIATQQIEKLKTLKRSFDNEYKPKPLLAPKDQPNNKSIHVDKPSTIKSSNEQLPKIEVPKSQFSTIETLIAELNKITKNEFNEEIIERACAALIDLAGNYELMKNTPKLYAWEGNLAYNFGQLNSVNLSDSFILQFCAFLTELNKFQINICRKGDGRLFQYFNTPQRTSFKIQKTIQELFQKPFAELIEKIEKELTQDVHASLKSYLNLRKPDIDRKFIDWIEMWEKDLHMLIIILSNLNPEDNIFKLGLELITLFHSKGISIDYKTKMDTFDLKSPLSVALESSTPSSYIIVDHLLTLGAEIKTIDKDGYKLQLLNKFYEKPELINVYLKHYPNEKNEFILRGLSYANKKNIPVLKLLIDKYDKSMTEVVGPLNSTAALRFVNQNSLNENDIRDLFSLISPEEFDIALKQQLHTKNKKYGKTVEEFICDNSGKTKEEILQIWKEIQANTK